MTRTSLLLQPFLHSTRGLSSHPAIAHAIPWVWNALLPGPLWPSPAYAPGLNSNVSWTHPGINYSSFSVLAKALSIPLLLPVTLHYDLFNCPAPLLECSYLQASQCQTLCDSAEGAQCLVHDGHLV